jgi:hypothetical protein
VTGARGGGAAAQAALAAHSRRASPRGPLATALAASSRRASSRGPLAAALAAASAWLIEPAEPPRQAVVAAPASMRPVVAVFGLARGCGATVVSRALAAELASRDAAAAAAVHCEARASGIPLATPAAGRLARLLAEVPGAETRAVGRLCLVGGTDCEELADAVRHVAPLILDAGSTALDGPAAAIADEVVLVTTPATAPALASVAADCLARLGHEPIVVVNRAPLELAAADSPPGEARRARPAVLALPHSRMGAQLAIGGREARGELGRAVAQVADRCEGRRDPRE